MGELSSDWNKDMENFINAPLPPAELHGVPLSDLFFGYPKNQAKPEKEPSASPEEIEAAEKVTLKLQEFLGIRSTADEIHIEKGGLLAKIDGPVSVGPTESLTNGNLSGYINIMENSHERMTAHEITHQIIAGEMEKVTPENIHTAVTETICDLASIEVGFPNISKDERTLLISELAKYYNDVVTDEMIADFRASARESSGSFYPYKEDTHHILGRRFGYTLREKLVYEDLSVFVGRLVTYPPTEEEIIDPEKYLDRVGDLPPASLNQSPKNVKVSISVQRSRLI